MPFVYVGDGGKEEDSAEVSAVGGSLYVCTWPEERPTVRIGRVGWRAWAKRSEGRGRVHSVSNMLRA